MPIVRKAKIAQGWHIHYIVYVFPICVKKLLQIKNTATSAAYKQLISSLFAMAEGILLEIRLHHSLIEIIFQLIVHTFTP